MIQDLTVTQCADATGMYRDTILNAVKTGRLPSTRRESDSAWLVSPAELFKLYPPKAEEPDAEDDPTDLLTIIAELKEDRDAWRMQAFWLTHGYDEYLAS